MSPFSPVPPPSPPSNLSFGHLDELLKDLEKMDGSAPDPLSGSGSDPFKLDFTPVEPVVPAAAAEEPTSPVVQTAVRNSWGDEIRTGAGQGSIAANSTPLGTPSTGSRQAASSIGSMPLLAGQRQAETTPPQATSSSSGSNTNDKPPPPVSYDPITGEELERPKGAPAVDLAKFRTKVCRNWSMGIHCQFAERCAFAHGDQQIRRNEEHNPYLEVYTQKKKGQKVAQAAPQPPKPILGTIPSLSLLPHGAGAGIELSALSQMQNGFAGLPASTVLSNYLALNNVAAAPQAMMGIDTQDQYVDGSGCHWFS
eukprot:TRINITY_DN21247_c0_g1_i2.p1 TRINITY_DN21247_c0_g1~~TRINITY_DN21247_c0_g1_i2.p1  ORF type:complete len:325 (+),score=69.87 TRINITY_DN21247_c0_g1_i2:47-976(+)